MAQAPVAGLPGWRPESRREPMVRIGVVLPADKALMLAMRVPDVAYDLTAATAGDTTPRTVRSAAVRARLADGGVDVALDDGPWQRASAWTLTPQQPRPPARGDGVFVHDVVAGRGFHWQKHVDQTLAGSSTLLPGAGGLVLVNELPLETYLAGVITAEMSSRCPADFLRAQCITARSWLLAFTEPKHAAEPFDRCNDDCCQRYQGTGDLSEVAIDAVQSTCGVALVAPGGRVVDANYSKSCGGIVELPEHVWGVHKPGLGPLVDAPDNSAARRFMPVNEQNLEEYLAGNWLAETDVYCSPRVVPEDQLPRYLGRVDESGHYFRWTVRYAHEELVEMLRSKLADLADLRRLSNLRVTKRGISGRATEIVFDFLDTAGRQRSVTLSDQYRIRQALHRSFLFSSAFAVNVERDEAGHCRAVSLRGAGWGHGAGMCQIGALGMALRGIDHERIVKHYFPGAELKTLYET